MTCRHQKYLRAITLAFLSLISVSLVAQEDCANGVDDDSDGLVDLNDPDCSCYVIDVDSLVADFEDYTCCPTNFTGGGQGIECLEDWTQGGVASTDYLNLCGYVGGTGIPLMPLPPPSGDGAVGFITMPGWSEYVGQCMPQSMIAGETYTVQLSFGFNSDLVWASSSPFTVGIYGATSCDNYPMSGSACPSDLANWFELATEVVVGPDSGWVDVNFSFTVSQNIEAIAFGGACSEIGGAGEYHFIDDIVIDGIFGGETVDVEDIEMTGDCVEGVELTIEEVAGATYQWYLDGVAIPGATSSTYDVVTGEDGEYTVVIDNGFGCGSSDPLDVTVDPNVLDVDGDVEDVDCTGSSTGSIDLTLPTENQPVTVEWGTGQMTEDLSDLLPGTYSVTITDANGCIGVETFFVIEPDAPLMVSMTNVEQPVGSGAQGSAEVETSGGTPIYEYMWDNGETTAVATMLEPGTHYVTITDANGCEEILEVLIYEPLVFLEDIVHQSCYNACDGSIELEVTGGLPDYTYEWDNGNVSPLNMDLCDGIYIVTITDAAGTEVVENFEIETPDEVVIIGEYTDVICLGQFGQITTEVIGGTPDYSYIWSNGETTPDIFDLFLDEYSLTVTDAMGCTAVEVFMIEILDSLLITGEVTPESCGGGGNGAIDISMSNGSGPFTFLWSNGFNGEDIDGLVAGTYSVTVMDALGCDGSAVFEVGEGGDLNVAIDIIDASCAGVADGSIDLTVDGGTAPYMYTWDTGDMTPGVSGLSSGDYQVTIEDNGGCVWTNVITVGEGEGVTFSGLVTDASCADSDDGAIDIDVILGTTPVSFEWSSGEMTEDISDLTSGTYTVTVTDANGCFADSTFTIDAPQPLGVSGIVTGASCPGVEDGGVMTTVTGGIDPYMYLWSNGDVDGDLSSVGPGDYDVTVTDANGCTVEMSFNVPALEPISLTSQVTSASCNGGTDGAIDITPGGGNPPFMFIWSNGEITEDIQNLTAGQYTVTITDDRGCMLVEQIDVFGAGSIAVQGVVSGISCNGDMNGAIDIMVNGGTLPLDFVWTTGDITEDVTGLGTGTYSVTITDAQGCEIGESFTIDDVPELTLDGFVTDVLCNGGTDGAVSVSAMGGTPPYDFLWNTGAITSDIQSLLAGIYTVTVTDANGCQAEDQFDVIEPPQLDIAVISITNPTMAGETGSAEVEVTGGTLPYDINWSNGESGTTATQLPIGSTFATAIDANGCMIGIEVVISVAAFSVNYASQSNACFGDCLGEISVEVMGGLPPYDISWSDGQSGEVAVNLCNGSYAVTVADGQGEEVVLQNLDITSPPEIMLTALSEDPSCISNDDGQISLEIIGGVGPHTILWNSGSDQQMLDGLSPGQYSVTVTDANGCTSTANYEIESVEALSLSVTPIDIDCSEEFGTIVISGDNPYNYTYLLNGQPAQVVQDSLITGLQPGSYEVAYEISPACRVDVDQTNIEVVSDFEIFISPENADVSFGESASFGVSIAGIINNYSIAWTIQGDFDCAEQDSLGNCTLISFMPEESQQVVVQVEDDLGCIDEVIASLTVTKDRNLFVPNVFSPNDDGVNDLVKVVVADTDARLNSFRIFSRWGEEVYSEQDRDVSGMQGWDGRYNGKRMMPGVYVFTAEVEYADGFIQSVSGDITLLN